ncbi:winged helix DNA-binding domain-containing protein [Dictyobacter arantiisoli]|uniref:Winged helix DNA-binding domain-containing protein n=1 Tax=Dictyobacter arantiisoli TaxID=2014874 RepID=A0A5A5TD85_9CHLR|nr:winged helix DNA-binding domain-containing protein [Dictyobacter arantiisoli]GCF09126.1 hypothetical protein KDI_26900 [Dictyobacter arantiisoli]
MMISELVRQRLVNQHIARTSLAKPEDVVQWLGAVQAQDYAAAKWALGLRLPDATDDVIEQAFTAGTLLRTHLMRPTWHFVLPADIRWLLALTAPRVNAANAYWYRKLELDEVIFKQSNAVLIKALQGGRQLTRPELVSVLQQAGIATDAVQRFTAIMMRAELAGIVCSGARRGKQFTYALLDERVPATKPLRHAEALAELVLRYFTGHGPATVQDFVWWSGLTVADARAGLSMVSSQLIHETVDGQTYWLATPTASIVSPEANSMAAYLLPNYDEYIVGYTDRSAIFDAADTEKLDSRGNVLFNNTLIIDGRVVGIWRRTLKKDRIDIVLSLFASLNDAEMHAYTTAAQRYAAFFGLPVNTKFQMHHGQQSRVPFFRPNG